MKRLACPTCRKDADEELHYGVDPDGMVLCRACRAPHLYCDLGGSV